MGDRESRLDHQSRRLLATLQRETVSSPAGLRERVTARIRMELLRRDLLDLFTAAPARALRQLLRREPPRSAAQEESTPPDPRM